MILNFYFQIWSISRGDGAGGETDYKIRDPHHPNISISIKEPFNICIYSLYPNDEIGIACLWPDNRAKRSRVLESRDTDRYNER